MSVDEIVPQRNIFAIKKTIDFPCHSIDDKCSLRPCAAEDIHRMTEEIFTAYPFLKLAGSKEHRASLELGLPIIRSKYEYDDAIVKVEGIPISYELAGPDLWTMITDIQQGLSPGSPTIGKYWLPEGLSNTDRRKILSWFDYTVGRMAGERLVHPPSRLSSGWYADPIALAILPLHNIWLIDYCARTEPMYNNGHWETLGNPMLPPDLLTHFCLHPAPLLRQSASLNPSCPEEGRVAVALLDIQCELPMMGRAI